ncbi:MAG: tetratricopeptide repeat protein [Acidobacteriaceae bacterium]
MAMLAKLVLFASMAFPFLLVAQQLTPEMASHARLAQDAERRNDFPTAVHEYRLLAQMLPDSAEIQSNLGVALYFDHELRPAVAAFHKAIAIDPGLMAPHLFSGLAWYQLSNPDSAVPELEKAVRINAKDPIAHTWLGYAYSSQTRYDAAVKQFEAASRLDPNNMDVWYALGHTWLQIGQQATLKLLARAPDGGRVWELAAEQCLLRQDPKGALRDFKQALARRPDLPELRKEIKDLGGTSDQASSAGHFTKGHATEDDLYGQARAAENQSHSAFERLIQIAPDSYRAHQIMAEAFVAKKQDSKAITEYRMVLQLKPDLPGIHAALGEALVRSGNLPAALHEFEAEIKLQPYSASAHTNAGRALLMLGRDQDAAKVLKVAVGLDRPPLETWLLLGKLDVRGGNFRGAIAELTHYTSLEKSNSTAYYLLAMAYRALGEKDQMDRAMAGYKATSEDARERSAAQRELKQIDQGSEADEQTFSDGKDSMK